MPSPFERAECACCREPVHNANPPRVSGLPVCGECDSSCSTTCRRCMDRVLRSTGRAYEWGGLVCEACAPTYDECSNCGILTSGVDNCDSCSQSDSYDSGYDDGGYDGSSYRDSGRQFLHDYSYRPMPTFFGVGPLYLGMELELETPDRGACAQKATERLGSVGYLKTDSSIGYGFEIVTHPMSYAWAMGQFPWAVLDELISLGAEINPAENGLHVHVSRAAFDGPCHIYRWLKFLYRNQQQVKTLARRDPSSWGAFSTSARRSAKVYAKAGGRDLLEALYRQGADTSRYQAINPMNEDTFEIRVFASSLNRREVQAALALSASSVEYTRDLTVSDIAQRGGWKWGAFASWLDDRPEYAPLAQEMEALACAC